MFTVFDIRPSPHQKNEFGDVNFEITYKGEKMTLVGIALICPMRFHTQLVKEIQYLSKLTKVRVLFYDDDFMIRLLAYYRKLNKI